MTFKIFILTLSIDEVGSLSHLKRTPKRDIIDLGTQTRRMNYALLKPL